MKEEMRYKWEITDRATGVTIAEGLGMFDTYEEAKKDLIDYIPLLNKPKGVEYNYTIYDVNSQSDFY